MLMVTFLFMKFTASTSSFITIFKSSDNLFEARFSLTKSMKHLYLVNEESFWRNYFYRVGLIRQSTELSSLEKENPAADSEGGNKETEGNKGAKGKEEDGEQPHDGVAQGGENEFVSDAFQPSSKDVEEVKKGISQLTKPSGEEDWEAELREELGEELNEFEVVEGTNKDNEHWEEELKNMIDDDDSTSDLR
ncbi:Synapse-associated protein 1 [Armadillidium nasatum]|uniref:Synapse-associated protein 1 n=1 Tax=Armadillidium nasatum TaxID=96803 RepID=A0A5N5TIV9_9CRUS|nr:Synapse-associated protein 1 [Armadillidium nasatum]